MPPISLRALKLASERARDTLAFGADRQEGPPPPLTEVHYVKITSTTLVSGLYYNGHRYDKWDRNATTTYTQQETCFIVTLNGERLQSGIYYSAKLTGEINGRFVYTVMFRPHFSGAKARTSNGFVGPGEIEWEGVAYDAGGYWNITDPERLTVPRTGVYLVIGTGERSSAGDLTLEIWKNGNGIGGGEIAARTTVNTNAAALCISTTLALSQGDWVSLWTDVSVTGSAGNVDSLTALSIIQLALIDPDDPDFTPTEGSGPGSGSGHLGSGSGHQIDDCPGLAIGDTLTATFTDKTGIFFDLPNSVTMTIQEEFSVPIWKADLTDPFCASVGGIRKVRFFGGASSPVPQATGVSFEYGPVGECGSDAQPPVSVSCDPLELVFNIETSMNCDCSPLVTNSTVTVTITE